MGKVSMTPKRAAQLLIYNWVTSGGSSPWYMDAEEMSYVMEGHGYRVTEKRREEILKHVDKMVEPLRQRCVTALEKAGISV